MPGEPAYVCHAYLAHAEALKEGVTAVTGKAIHMSQLRAIRLRATLPL